MYSLSRITCIKQLTNRWVGLYSATLALLGIAGSASADQTVSLAWEVQTNSSGYILRYGSESGQYTTQIDVGTNSVTAISGLKEGLNYYVAVSAYDKNGIEGELSNEISFTTPGVLFATQNSNPLAPAHLRFPVLPAHGYEVQASENMASWRSIWQTTAVSNNWVEFDDPDTNKIPARFYRLVLH